MPMSALAEGALGDALAAVPPINAGGVPARRAQPGRIGPSAAHAAVVITATAMATRTPDRSVAIWPAPGPILQATAATTVSVHAATSASDHVAGASGTGARECKMAPGHDAYASQCTVFHALKPRKGRSALVTTSASTSSAATTPSPSQNGRYVDTNGMAASRQPSFAYGSATAVTTWASRKTTAKRLRLRCNSALTKRGQPRERPAPPAVRIPSATTAVSRRRVAVPAPRVANQSGLGVAAAIIPASPPAMPRYGGPSRQRVPGAPPAHAPRAMRARRRPGSQRLSRQYSPRRRSRPRRSPRARASLPADSWRDRRRGWTEFTLADLL